MPEKILEIVKAWRKKGIDLSDDDADKIYRFCIRKMEISKVEKPDEYIFLLYPDELKNHLLRCSINAFTMLRMLEMEVRKNVFNLSSDTMPSSVS